MGLSAHKVKQRDYDQLFSFRDYSTITGHLGVYFDLPYQIRSQLLVGKYSRRRGNYDLSRRFNSGLHGSFATKTNLSAESLVKEVLIRVFTYLFLLSCFILTLIRKYFLWTASLTKDGGAILNKHNALISILGDSNESSITRDWNNIIN